MEIEDEQEKRWASAGKYTLEFKLEAVRLVKGGPAVSVKAKILRVPVQTLGNWVRLSAKGQLKGASASGYFEHCRRTAFGEAWNAYES